jgi:hypothetical protein
MLILVLKALKYTFIRFFLTPGPANAQALLQITPQLSALGPSYYLGLIFWFTRNKFVRS